MDNINENFLALTTRKEVAQLLGMEEKALCYLLYVYPTEKLYKEFSIAKRMGGERTIAAPIDALKTIQKKLARILEEIYEPKVCAYGFIKSRNYIDNASKHLRRNCLLNIDLENFFSQIHFGRVRGLFLSAPYNLTEVVATTIAQIACYKGCLPQGAPSSPVITNMICKSLDNSLMRLAKNYQCNYTRYADDITFSTYLKDFSPDIIAILDGDPVIGKELSKVLHKNDFKVNIKKIHLSNKYTHQEVTGLTVNHKLNIRRRYLKSLRAIIHNCTKNDVLSTAKLFIAKNNINKFKTETDDNKIIEWFKSVLKGRIQFIGQVKGKNSFTYLKMARELNEVFEEDILDVVQLMDFESQVAKNVFILKGKTSDLEVQGSAFYLKGSGLLTSYHVVEKDLSFDVKEYKDNRSILTIGLGFSERKSNKNIDYALFEFTKPMATNMAFAIGDSTKIKIQDSVTVVGFPNYKENDTPYIHTCSITHFTPNYLGSILYRVSAGLVHGISGGIVLNNEKEVIGLIKAGIVSMQEEQNSIDSGFVPIHLILQDLSSST